MSDDTFLPLPTDANDEALVDALVEASTRSGQMTPQERFRDAQRRWIELRQEVLRLRIVAQLSCEHPTILEAPTTGEHYVRPPWRVCEACGFSERGWGCGYQILKRADRHTDWREALEVSEGAIHPNHRFVRDGDIHDKRVLYERAVHGEPEIDP